MEIELRDGEQDVILSGQASLAVEFNRIGNEKFVTLRIFAGDASTAHAVLSSTARYDFELEGQIYYINVLRVDFSSKSVRLRVDRKRSS
jgi:hypothetical protein